MIKMFLAASDKGKFSPFRGNTIEFENIGNSYKIDFLSNFKYEDNTHNKYIKFHKKILRKI
jgi:hypothetical protein